jgi:flagellar basal-body rod modification protein FlgD
MSVAATAAATTTKAAPATTSTTANDARKATLNYDSFLRLLVAEMKNQDPTAPKDTSQYMAQLASFSAVEQGVNTNKKLDAMMTSLALTQANSLIGRHITSADGSKSGIVNTVEIGDGGSTAVLRDGTRITLENGIKVAEP